GHLEVMPLGEVVLVEQQGAPARLADQQVLPAVVAEIAGDDGAAVAVVIGAGQEAEVKEVPPADVDPGPLALVAAEVVAVDDLPGVLDPELAQGLVHGAGGGDLASAVARL